MKKLLQVRSICLYIFLAFIFCVQSFDLSAQSQQRFLSIYGEVKEGRKSLDNVQVKLYKSGSPVKQEVAPNGRFEYFLDLNSNYTLEVAKDGYVSKKLSFNTSVPAEDTLNWTFDFVIELFQQVEGLNTAIFTQPVAKIYYNKKFKDFDYDIDYSMEFQQAEEEMYEEMERLKEKEAEQAAAEAAKKEELNKRYNSAMAEGDKQMGKGNHQDALAAYQKATEIKPEEQQARDKVAEVKELIKNKAANQKEFETTIAAAHEAFEKKEYEKAKGLYERALELNPEAPYADERIRDIPRLIEEREEAFKTAVALGDEQFEKKDYKASLESFERANLLKPDRDYPKQKIKELTPLVEAILAKEKEFNLKIAAADKAFDAEKYDQAKMMYEQALEMKPGDQHATDRIAEIQSLKQKKEEGYQAAVAEGDKALEDKNFEAAKNAYNKALEIKPGESYPQQKLNEIEKLKQQYEAEKEAFEQGIAMADKAFDQKNYDKAKSLYEKALDIMPGDKHAEKRIEEIAEIQKEQQQEYNELIAEADKAFEEEDFEKAQSSYQEAQQLMPSEKYPQEKLDEIAEIKEQQKANQQAFEQAVASADQAFDEKRYDEAKTLYEQALKIKAGDKHAEKRIEEIAEIQQEKEEEYNELIASADEAFSGKEYEDAKASYEEALKLKPSEKYPQEKLDEIAEIREQQKANQQAFEQAVASADQAFEANKYDEAEILYQQALNIQPDAKHPKKQLEEINKLRQDKLEAYDELVAEGDKQFGKENYTAAKSAYEKALTVKPEESYPKDKLAEIDSIITAQKETEQKYQQAIAAGDKLMSEGKFEQALTEYKSAQEVKPGENYPQEKIDEINELMAARQAQEVEYQEAIAAADEAFAKENYSAAVTAYEKALKLKPDESYPQQKIAKAEELMASQNAAERAYNNAINLADQAFDNNDFEQAKLSYKQALEIQPAEQYPQDKISEIEKILKQQDKLDEEYLNILASADEAFQGGEFKQSITLYEQALEVKKEEYPREQINKALEQIEAESAREAEYEAAISDGDKQLQRGRFEQAIIAYQTALDLKPEAEYPKKKIAQAEGMLQKAVQQEQQQEELQVERKAREEAERKAAEEALRKKQEAAAKAEEEERRKAEEEARLQEELKAQEQQAIEEARAKAAAEAEKRQQDMDRQAKDEEPVQSAVEDERKEAELMLYRLKEEEEQKMRKQAEYEIRQELEANLQAELAQAQKQRVDSIRQENLEARLDEMQQRREEEIAAIKENKKISEERAQEMEEARKAKEEAERERIQAKNEAAMEKMEEEKQERIIAQREAWEEEKQLVEQKRQERKEELDERSEERINAFQGALETSKERKERLRKEREESRATQKAMRDSVRQAALARKEEQNRREAEERQQLQAQKDSIAALAQEKEYAQMEEMAEAQRQRKAEVAGKLEQFKLSQEQEEQMREQEREERLKQVKSKSEAHQEAVNLKRDARDIAQKEVQEKRDEIYASVREKLEAEYEEKRKEAMAELNRMPESKELKAETNELGQQYPNGITTESETEYNRQITRIIVNRAGYARKYEKVKWNWGGVYYFRDGESITKAIFNQGTTW